MRVDMEVGEMLGYIVACYGHLLHFFLVDDRLKGNAGGPDHLWVGGLEVLDELCIHAQIMGIQYATTHQLKEHSGGSFHVGSGIVGVTELLAKQDLVELLQAWQLELPALATWQLTELGCLLGAGVHLLVSVKRVVTRLAQELAAKDVEVEVDVMAHQVCRLGRRLQEDGEHLAQRLAVFGSIFGGDMVHHLGIDGNLKAFGNNDIVVVFHEATLVVVHLPCQLYHAWPVVEVGQRRVIVFG